MQTTQSVFKKCKSTEDSLILYSPLRIANQLKNYKFLSLREVNFDTDGKYSWTKLNVPYDAKSLIQSFKLRSESIQGNRREDHFPMQNLANDCCLHFHINDFKQQKDFAKQMVKVDYNLKVEVNIKFSKVAFRREREDPITLEYQDIQKRKHQPPIIMCKIIEKDTKKLPLNFGNLTIDNKPENIMKVRVKNVTVVCG